MSESGGRRRQLVGIEIVPVSIKTKITHMTAGNLFLDSNNPQG